MSSVAAPPGFGFGKTGMIVPMAAGQPKSMDQTASFLESDIYLPGTPGELVAIICKFSGGREVLVFRHGASWIPTSGDKGRNARGSF